MHERSINKERYDAMQTIRASQPQPTAEFVAKQQTKPRLKVWKTAAERK